MDFWEKSSAQQRTKGSFTGVWGQKAESAKLLISLAPSFWEDHGMPLPTLVLPDLWYQLPLFKGPALSGTANNPFQRSTLYCAQVQVPHHPLRSKTMIQAVWTRCGRSVFCWSGGRSASLVNQPPDSLCQVFLQPLLLSTHKAGQSLPDLTPCGGCYQSTCPHVEKPAPNARLPARDTSIREERM